MIRQNEIKEIVNLIDKGFELELIAFELGIPVNQLQECISKEKTEKELNEDKNEEIEIEFEEKKFRKQDYEKLINKYKKEIALKKSTKKRNLLAFAYFKAGKIEEARDELEKLINENNNYISYRQLIHIEKQENNLDDAKLWAYEALEKFPESIEIREQLISIAKEEKDNQEIIKQLKEIIDINPKNKINKKRLKIIMEQNER